MDWITIRTTSQQVFSPSFTFQIHRGFIFVLFLCISQIHQRSLFKWALRDPQSLNRILLPWFLNGLNYEYLRHHPWALSETTPSFRTVMNLSGDSHRPLSFAEEWLWVQELLEFLLSWKFLTKALGADTSWASPELPVGFSWGWFASPDDILQCSWEQTGIFY